MLCSEVDLAFLRQLIQSRSGNALDPLRNNLFEARLRSLWQSLGMSSLGELVHQLRFASDPLLEQSVVEAMTINETSFFRDHAPFDLLREELLPRLIRARRAERRLLFWSAACSSGQEAYSLAMLLRDGFPHLADWKIEILGTDLHATMIQRARRGRYQRFEVNRGLPARYLLRYFRRDGEEWEVDPALRAICRFEQKNLLHFAPFLTKFDGILLRNVLFYFSSATQQSILTRVHASLRSDGFLLLGPSECAHQPGWRPVLHRNVCYYIPE
ncbi:MAG: protein-glutamate O-methyltransferase CheR [Bacillota bacterium]|nr:protein-glutamate O-methyltransferase CheR [Pseudacidobacterium ailaaui]MDI3255009.1 protein-glutamate O-methyltransferase CheR [Bacillota bacterium]